MIIIELEAAFYDVRAGFNLLQGKLGVLSAQSQTFQFRLALTGNAERVFAYLEFLCGKIRMRWTC